MTILETGFGEKLLNIFVRRFKLEARLFFCSFLGPRSALVLTCILWIPISIGLRERLQFSRLKKILYE